MDGDEMLSAPRLFSLVSVENEYEIYLVGIDMGDEAITYRPAFDGRGSQFGVHSSAEAALKIHRMIADLRLIWNDDHPTKALAS
jgi:hypothetical protein